MEEKINIIAVIKRFLEHDQLYVKRNIQDSLPLNYGNVELNISKTIPRQLDLFCEKCSREVTCFCHPEPQDIEKNHEYFFDLSYYCVRCGALTRFDVIINDEGDSCSIMKFGEYPRKKLSRDKKLHNFYEEEDQDLLDKAEECLATGYGIGAFAYLRQTLEKNIHRILDEIKQQATDDGFFEVAKAIDEIQNQPQFSDKIKAANDVMPQYLKCGDLNPMGLLYQHFSVGIHSGTDEECLDKANEIYSCMCFIVGQLAVHKAERIKLKERLGSIKKIKK